MKALTICQPYAELIARGDKPIENRTWGTRYRGPLAIHAGKSRAWLSIDDDDPRANYGVDVTAISFGAVVAVARLRGCCRIEDLPLDLRDHMHAEGPWCWILEDVQRLPMPIACNGAQGLWEWQDSITGRPAPGGTA